MNTISTISTISTESDIAENIETEIYPLKYGTYSYSRLSTHEQCSRKFKYKYVLKLPEEDSDRTALFRGIQIHNFLEKYPNTEDVKITDELKEIQLRYINSDIGQKYLELNTLKNQKRETKIQLHLNTEEIFNTQSDDSKRKDLQFYGLVDYVNVLNVSGSKILNIVDYKTGKYKDSKYQDYNQLMFYQIYYFLKFKEINQIRIQYSYVEHLQENELILDRKYLNNYIEELLRCIKSQENSTFEPNFSKLCDYCPFQKICASDQS